MAQIRIPKDVDELLALQDRAIQALQQATLALQIALQALQDSRIEKGDQQRMTFVPVPNAGPYIMPAPYINPTITPWGTTTCGVASTQYNGSAQDAVVNAIDTVQMASNFACSGGGNQ